MIWTLSALLAAAQAAPAQPAPVDDVRCFIAASSLIGNAEPAINLVGLMGANYFLGRIDGAATANLEQRMTEAAAEMTQAEISALLQSCGALMKARGDAVQDLGKRIADKASIAPPKSS